MLLHSLVILVIQRNTLVLNLHNTLLVFSACQILRQYCGSYSISSGTLLHVSMRAICMCAESMCFLAAMQPCSWLGVAHH